MINYFYDVYCILNKVYSDGAFVKQAISSTPIEEVNRAKTVKTVYGVLDKDIELSYYVKYLTEKSPKLAIRTILKIAMYVIKYLNKHDYAVTKSAVELTKKLGKGGASGFVNAFLRRFLSEEIPLPTDKIENLSVKYSYPPFAVSELIKDYGEERAISIMSSFNQKTCLAFYGTDGATYLKEKGQSFSETPYKNVFLLDNFVRNADYDDGVYTYQAIGSVAICEGIEPCDKILDCCSAPGGKSIRLSYKCKAVYAFDKHEHRVNLISEYVKRMKRENVYYSVCDAKVYNSEYERFFDAVLCDAPCSGLGVVNDNPDIKLNRDEKAIDNLNVEQLSILKTVVLSRENIEIIKKFMSDIKGFEIVETKPEIPYLDVLGTVQFLPDISYGNGFYFAKLKRVY